MYDKKYPFVDMAIGDKVVVPKDQYHNARASTDYYWRKHNMKFSWEKTPHGNYHCTRIEPNDRHQQLSPYSAQFKALKVGERLVVSAKEYGKAQPLGAYYSRRLGITLSWRCWPDGRHACTRVK